MKIEKNIFLYSFNEFFLIYNCPNHWETHIANKIHSFSSKIIDYLITYCILLKKGEEKSKVLDPMGFGLGPTNTPLTSKETHILFLL